MKRALLDIALAGLMAAAVLLIHDWMEFRDWKPECQKTHQPYSVELVIADGETVIRCS